MNDIPITQAHYFTTDNNYLIRVPASSLLSFTSDAIY